MADLAWPSRQFRSDLPTFVAAATSIISLRPLDKKRSSATKPRHSRQAISCHHIICTTSSKTDGGKGQTNCVDATSIQADDNMYLNRRKTTDLGLRSVGSTKFAPDVNECKLPTACTRHEGKYVLKNMFRL
jgi:hypothetical protein